MMDFFNMGGYAFYVWTTWVCSTLALSGLFWLRKSRLERARRALAQHETAE